VVQGMVSLSSRITVYAEVMPVLCPPVDASVGLTDKCLSNGTARLQVSSNTVYHPLWKLRNFRVADAPLGTSKRWSVF